MKLSPKTVAKVTFWLASQFSVHSERFMRMLPTDTPTVSQILLNRFPSLADSTDLFNVNDPLTGMEVLIPAGDGYHHGAKPFSSEACLVFGYDGSFVFVERHSSAGRGRGEHLLMDKLTEAGLAKVVGRFPDLGWTLVYEFFPYMIRFVAGDIKRVSEHLSDMMDLVQGIKGKFTLDE